MLESFTSINNYVFLSQIGEGTYGKVFSGKNIKSNEVVAIKKLKLYTTDVTDATTNEVSSSSHNEESAATIKLKKSKSLKKRNIRKIIKVDL